GSGDASRCVSGGVGPTAVDAAGWVDHDVTPDGVVGLTGNVKEMVTEGELGLSHPCWHQQLLRGIHCEATPDGYWALRGGSWYSGRAELAAIHRSRTPQNGFLDGGRAGFRCARAGRSP